MLNYENQLNLGNIYSNCQDFFKEQRPEFLELLDKYIDVNTHIPYSFKKAFYSDTLLILILKLSSEICSFCGINKVPDASK